MIQALKKSVFISIPLCIATLILLWFSNYFQAAIGSDVSFLTLAAEKFLLGMKMSEAYYDTNPPLSILIYVPAVLLSQLSGLQLYTSLHIYFTLLFTISFILSVNVIRKLPNITHEQRVIILCCFAYITTIFSGYDFGQKDHILALFLFPLVILQLLLTYGVKVSAIVKWSILILASVFILIKPHFGLVPLFLFSHRIVLQKRFNIYKDHDFLALACAAIIYAILLITVFNDYLFEIMPNVISLYANDISQQQRAISLLIMLISLTPVALGQTIFKKMPEIVQLMSVIAFLCMIPVFMQGKGFLYHAIPHKIFFAGAWTLLICYAVNASLKEITFLKLSGYIIATGFICWLCIQGYTNINKLPKHEIFKTSKLSDVLNDCSRENCSFFMFTDTINISQELSLYTRKKNITRFPTPWYFPVLLYQKDQIKQGLPAQYTQKEVDEKLSFFLSLEAQTIQKNTPDILIIGHVKFTGVSDEIFDFKNFSTEHNETFKDIWMQYELDQSITVDRADYMARKFPNEELTTYDIYLRKNSTQNTK